MNASSNTLGLPREGSKVRLIGLKNPDLNGKVGHISSYSRDGERVMISLVDGPQGLVKVKPKQIEVLEEAAAGGGGRPGMDRRGSSSRRMSGSDQQRRPSVSRDRGGPQARSMQRPPNRMNGSQRNFNASSTSNMRRVSSRDNFRDNGSQATDMSQEVMDTLRSADAMFDLADTSGDGVISQQEFEYYMKKHTNHDIDMIRECFYTIDADHNGDITRDEVRNAFLKKRREVKGKETSDSKKKQEDELMEVSRDADALFDRADVDNSGSLSIREFELYMKRHTTHSDAAIHELFDSMDVDKDGFITREEVRKAYMDMKNKDGGKLTLMDILGLDDDEMAEIEDDVYNMFFLATTCSSAWWFALLVFILKMGLIMIIVVDLFQLNEDGESKFPDSADVPLLVKTTQFLLLPVNVSVQEELITTFYLYANLKWSKRILELSPGASKAKYHMANFMRFCDGLIFLFINTTLLLQATQVLGAFLNFAALQFLSSIDNVALHLARDGYLTDGLEDVAEAVLHMKLPRNHNDNLQVLDSVLLGVVYLGQVVAWIVFMFLL